MWYVINDNHFFLENMMGGAKILYLLIIKINNN